MLVRSDLVRVGMVASCARDALREMADGLVAAGYARASFPQAIVEREARFPTGLPGANAGFDVAIPHTDPTHVLTPAIAVATLARPVEFAMMGNASQRLHVRLILMLGVTEATTQINTLQRLMDLLHDPEALRACMACDTPDALFALVARRLDGAR